MKKRFIVLLAAALILPNFALVSSAKAVGTPSLSYPAADSVLTNYPRTVNFSWGSVSGAQQYELEVACDVCVSKTYKWQGAKTYITTARNYSLTMAGDNQFRWRVRAVDTDGNQGYWTEYRYFTFKTGSSGSSIGVPVITQPYNGQKFSSGYATIVWSAVSGATSYSYEIQKYNSDSATWSTNSNYSTGNTSIYPYLADSQYRVRVKATNGSTSGAWTIWTFFDVGNTWSTGLSIPTLVSPADESSVSNNYVYLDWSDVSAADSYEYQVTKYNGSTWDAVTSKIVYSSNDYVTLPSGSYGMYSYRVRSIDGSQYSDWSGYFQFYYYSGGSSYGTPYINTPYSGQNFSSHDVNVSWSSVSGAVGYEVNVQYKSGSYWYEERTQSTSNTYLNVYVPYDNSYRVRVRAKYSDYNYGSWTEWREFSVGSGSSYHTTNPPTINTPYNNQSYGSGSTVAMTWSTVTDADRYEISVEYESNGSWYAEGSYTIYSTNYSKYFGYNNEYRMRIRARFSDDTYTNWSDYRYFTVGSTGSYSTSAPVIYAPTDSQYFSSYSTVNFSWNSLTSVYRYEIAVEYQSGSNWYAEGNYNSTSNTYSKYFSQNNAYRVRVRAQFNDYTYSNWSDYRYFTVGTQSTTYDVPVISNPTTNQVFSNGSVAVDWNDVSMALRYEMNVEYQSGGNWYTETTYTNLTSSYQLLSLFYHTNYRIRVRAVFVQDTGAWTDYRYFSVQ